MEVNSLPFLAFFLVVFAANYFFSRSRASFQNFILLVSSYFFYGYVNVKMLWLLFGATVAFYFLGIGIARCGDAYEKRAARLTTLGVLLGVGVLFYFKYLDFSIEQFAELFSAIGLQTNLHSFGILMPVGISFFTFRLMSYVIEVHRGHVEPCRDFIAFATYVAFFPCILSGPIDRPKSFLGQLSVFRKFDYSLAIDGLRQILWGMFTKMVVADNCAMVVDRLWGNYSERNGSSLLVAIFLYSVQLYADFSGYSNMAIGVAKLLGIKVARNFNYPFFAKNMAEYWRRWHMSLTSWLTDYVFTPLSIKFRNFANIGIILAIIINFAVVGLWHGANWTYLVWGVFHGILFIPLILAGRMSKKQKLETGILGLPTFMHCIKSAMVFIAVTVSLILFRAPSIGDAFAFVKRMLFSGTLTDYPNEITAGGKLLPIFILLMFILEWYTQKSEHFLAGMVAAVKFRAIRWAIYIVVILVVLQYDGGGTKFIYFQF